MIMDLLNLLLYNHLIKTKEKAMTLMLNEGAKEIISLLNQNNHKAYAVGGCVRDQLMGKTPFDFDITTDATAEEMLEIFSSYKIIKSGIKHGTVAVIINGEVYECTTFRIDGDYKDSRHPDRVYFSRNLADDLSRRDFTINALCYSEAEGLIDIFSGRKDIENKIIRSIGDAEKRFKEDALRILRGMRFSSTLCFSIEEKTKDGMICCAPLLEEISKERKTEELKKMICGENLLYVIDSFQDIFRLLLPGINLSTQPKEELIASNKAFEYRMSLILRNTENKEEIFTNLRFSNATLLNIRELSSMNIPESKVELKKMLKKYKKDNVLKYIDSNHLEEARKWYSEIMENNECYSLKSLSVTGKDILKTGADPKKVGTILDTLLDRVIEETTPNTKEELLKLL